MSMLKRLLKMNLPKGQSAFLWGPRKTGKSTYLHQAYPDSPYYDFLKTDLRLKFIKNPAILREELLAKNVHSHVILDEVQKVPAILDEVHWLIENAGIDFILCGSSARKLKRGQANLLGGRAWRYEMFPFVYKELEEFNLLRALRQGLTPSHYLQDNYKRSLQAYVEDYLQEEVFAEGLTRNIPAFSRFFESMAYSHGELTNYSNIARDCGVDSKTVKEYYQILVDTLLGNNVPPFSKRRGRQIITKHSKFYLFDTGIAGYLCKRQLVEERGAEFGKAFEHFIFTELSAHSSYSELNYDINFWRTKTGLEVDFVLAGGEIAIEVKGARRVDKTDLKALREFEKEYKPRQSILVTNETSERRIGEIRLLPYAQFLEQLWAGEIVS